MHFPPNTHRRSMALAVLAAVALAACGHRSADTPAGQVVAKVNGDEISIHQVNFALSNAGPLNETQAKTASRQVLERLVDQQILVQKALEKKLDRSPRVVQALDASRRQILAQAYLEQLLGDAPKPTSTQVHEYYDAHPELFKERRIYRFQEVHLDSANKDIDLEAVRHAVQSAKNLQDVMQWASSQKFAFNETTTTRRAEELPLDVLPAFHQLKDGQLTVLPTPRGIVVGQLLASQTAALDEKQAQPFIEQYLANQARQKLAQTESKALRANAKLEYMGEFAKTGADPQPKPGVQGSTGGGSTGGVVQPVAATSAAAPSGNSAPAAAVASANEDKAVLQKGLSDLK